MEGEKTKKNSIFKKILILLTIWLLVLSPAICLWGLIEIANDETLPKIKELENPKTDLASVIYSSDLVNLGKYYHENRTNIHYNYIPKSLINALIATEDERFFEHSGIDIRALGRVLKGVVTGNLKRWWFHYYPTVSQITISKKKINKI